VDSLGCALEDVMACGTARAELGGRGRKSCVCIHLPQLVDPSQAVLTTILQETLEPLFGERRHELVVGTVQSSSGRGSGSGSGAGAGAVPSVRREVREEVPAIAAATAELYLWVRRLFVQNRSSGGGGGGSSGSRSGSLPASLSSASASSFPGAATLAAVRLAHLPSHFTATRHHLSRVVQGIASTSTEFVTTQRALRRAWLHEMARVFEDQLTTLEQIRAYRGCAVGVMQRHFLLSFPANNVGDSRRSGRGRAGGGGLVQVKEVREKTLVDIFQRLVLHKCRRVLLFWRALVWQNPTDVGACEELFFAGSSKAMLQKDNDHGCQWLPQNLKREEPKLQFQLILSDLAHAFNVRG
jgi:hypothetical protein